MSHTVISEKHECPKCKQMFMGACVQVYDILVCNNCYYEKFQKELEPKLKKELLDYFNSTESYTEELLK